MMKKILIVFVVSLSILLLYGYAGAISGVCANCHTMHNSQGGAPMAKDFAGAPLSTPQPNLLMSTCLGCHNGQVTNAPDIFETTVSVNRTAGGTFLNAVFTTDQKGHNVKDLVDAGVLPTAGAEDTLTGNPPGAETGGYTEPTGLQLSCAGALGCHGDHTKSGSAEGIKGFHHAPSGKGYRFLQFYDGATSTAIQGKGSSDWEKGGATATNHNVYYALSDDDSTNVDSISRLCSLCHGGFHGESDTLSGSSWIRHPTENLIPSAWNSIGTGVTVDYEKTPFAFNGTDYNTVTTAAAYSMTNNPRVACVSCHRAHASAEDDALRFTYNMSAGGGGTTGCLACHTAQR